VPNVLRTLVSVVLLSVFACLAPAQTEKKPEKKPDKSKPKRIVERPTPTVADVAYGEHPRQKLDFWQAKSETPTPLVVLIHGGGWNGGDKSGYGTGSIKPFLDVGISVASINYRFIAQGIQDKVVPPVKAPLHDAARAIQFLRSKAKEWNIDKTRVGATGGSAGACTSLWLAYHPDLADPKSEDPVARESTRLQAVAVGGAQTSLDPKQVREWMPNANYGAHAFGFRSKKGDKTPLDQAIEDYDKILPWIKEYSPIALVTKDAPPTLLAYGKPDTPVEVGQKPKDPTHSPIYGLKLVERLKEVGAEGILTYPGGPKTEFSNVNTFLIAKLKGKG
jgi:acetyl esterase/lipase